MATESRLEAYQELQGEEMWESLLNYHTISVWGHENILEIDIMMVGRTCECN